VERYQHDGLTFDVRDEGPDDGDAVVLLHGFPQTSASWDDVAPLLHDAGYRTLAPDQRGYSPGARPRGRRAYRQSEVVGDVVGLLNAAGLDRAHVVGHDWGGGVAWHLAMVHPERVRTLTAISAPHPAAFIRALRTSSQLFRSWYMFAFQLPFLPELGGPARNPQRFARQLVGAGLSDDKARAYTDRLAEPGAFTAAVNWYRGAALPSGIRRASRVTVPTLFVWSSGDRFLARRAAELTKDYVDAPFRIAEIEGADHWLPDNEAARVVELLLPHLGQG
jgi:pimeloyl-ACP methyl ester carboxylesterase